MQTEFSHYVLPNKADILQFPLFKNLNRENIHLISNSAQCLIFKEELETAAILGFDSESKPTFKKGEISTGPHLIQLATDKKAYLFQMNSETWQFLSPILASSKQLKVGFGLKNDAHLFRKKGVELQNTLDLAHHFRIFGYKNQMGVKIAMALLFKVNLSSIKNSFFQQISKGGLIRI